MAWHILVPRPAILVRVVAHHDAEPLNIVVTCLANLDPVKVEQGAARQPVDPQGTSAMGEFFVPTLVEKSDHLRYIR
jgi:hypothetical protein